MITEINLYSKRRGKNLQKEIITGNNTIYKGNNKDIIIIIY